MANGLKERGATGIVVDGCILTAEVLKKREDIPVFSRGMVSRANPAAKPGWLNVPAICGGVIVNPGDLIVGDEDGVVVVPRDWVPDIITQVEVDNAQRLLDGNIPPREPQSEPYYERCNAETKLRAVDNIEWQ